MTLPVQYDSPHKSNRQQDISLDSGSAQNWSLSINKEKIAHASYEQTDFFLFQENMLEPSELEMFVIHMAREFMTMWKAG